MQVFDCKIGDRVICVDNAMVEKELTIGEIIYDAYFGDYLIENDTGTLFYYSSNYFIDLKEERRRKLEKLECIFNSNGE